MRIFSCSLIIVVGALNWPQLANAQFAESDSQAIEALLPFQNTKPPSKEAIKQLHYNSGKGDIVARWTLGKMYEKGHGVKVNQRRAFEFYAKIVHEAKPGDSTRHRKIVASSMVGVASFFMTQGGDKTLPRDLPMAKNLLHRAATYYKDADAQFLLAEYYFKHGDRADNYAAGLRWLHMAANNGHIGAQSDLGRILFFGEGVMPKPAQGLMWISFARLKAQREDGDEIEHLHEAMMALATETQRREAELLVAAHRSQILQ